MQNAVWSALRRSRTESITEMFALPVGSRYWALVQQDGKYLWERPFISPRKSNPWRLTDVYISREDDNRDTRKQMPELAGPAPGFRWRRASRDQDDRAHPNATVSKMGMTRKTYVYGPYAYGW